MSWLVAGIHVFLVLKASKKDVDARDKLVHDAGEVVRLHRNAL